MVVILLVFSVAFLLGLLEKPDSCFGTEGDGNCTVHADIQKPGSWSIVYNFCWYNTNCHCSCTLADDQN